VYYRNKRDKLLKGKKCFFCGSTLHLEFHHKNPLEKDFDIMTKIQNKDISSEIDKCIILCRKCHHEIHKKGLIHGTINGYSHYKCRCDLCKEAWNKNDQAYKQRKIKEALNKATNKFN
jgi:hypothetical protein